MTIKLVRTDIVDASKILLPQGDHIIGRGKLLECDDKRISREHGRLDVSEDSLTIKALHQNPCFYTKNGSTEVEILKQDNSVVLRNGDKFGLLPDTFWYEVLYCCPLETFDNCDSEKNTEDYCMEQNHVGNETTSIEANSDKPKVNTSNIDDRSGPVSPSLIDDENIETPQVSTTTTPRELITKDTNAQSQQDTTTQKELVSKETDTQIQQDKEIEKEIVEKPIIKNEPKEEKEETDSQNKSKENQNELNEEPNVHTQEQNTNASNSGVKRSHSPEVSDIKKVKTEPNDTKNDGAGPSVNPDHLAATNNGAPGVVNPGTNNVNNPPRERCMYGANCYRRNPQHLAQFSHPRDPDWGPGERGVCPYGASCMKTDPRHWRDHEHPPGKVPQARPGMHVVEKHGNVFIINAHSVNFYDDHFQVEDSDGDSVDYDYEF